MVCGIAGIPLFFVLVLPIVAIVLGAVALSRVQRAGGRGRGRAWAGLVLGIVGVLLFVGIVVIGALLGWYGDDVAADDLEVGQCVELDVDDTEISSLPLVDCDEPHQAEVYLVEDIEGGDEIPDTDSLIARGQELCAGDAFEAYVGTSYEQSELEFYTVYPSEDTWEDGDREIVCLAIRPDGGDLTATVRDTAS